jgi:predicted RNA binding protein YcfA (HicA-like mRNA interferase family)
VSRWRAAKASRVFGAFQRIGWTVKREVKGSHKVLQREGFPNFVWAFHDRDEIGPRLLARIAKRTGLRLADLKSTRGARTYARVYSRSCRS